MSPIQKTSVDWGSALSHLGAAVGRLMVGSTRAVLQVQQANVAAAMRGLALMGNTYARAWGAKGEDVIPSDNPFGSAQDRRFADDAWHENLAFDIMRQAYLISSQWMKDMAGSVREIDPALGRRAEFYTGQLADALSPANFPLTNPEVLAETLRTGGANLARGAQSYLRDLRQGRISQVAAGKFEVGVNLAVTPGKVVYRNKLIELLQYTPTTPQVRAAPMLMIPPWVNKYYVMDLSPHNSLFKHLVDAGFTVFAISWKNPDSSYRDMTWDDYVTLGPLTALAVVKSITGAERINTVGYCLGGIIQQVMLAYLAAVGERLSVSGNRLSVSGDRLSVDGSRITDHGSPITDHGSPITDHRSPITINTATYFATHQDYDDVGDIAVFISDPEVRFLEFLMSASGGYLDGRNMAATFNMLRANDLLWHYWVNNYLMGKEPPAFDLLYWNSDGTRTPETVHSYLLRNFFLEKQISQPGALVVKGVGIDTRRITAPTYAVATIEDHIVPWRGMFKIHEMQTGPIKFVLGESGHIAGIINPPGAKKRGYWTNDAQTRDPAAWLEGATKHPGSWWPDWHAWLAERSGDLVVPPPIGNEAYPVLGDAPGGYVLER
jgi:polyhydroxyalkanoate synthase